MSKLMSGTKSSQVQPSNTQNCRSLPYSPNLNVLLALGQGIRTTLLNLQFKVLWGFGAVLGLGAFRGWPTSLQVLR